MRSPATRRRRCRWLLLALLLVVLLALLSTPPVVYGPPGIPLSPPSRLLPMGYWLHRRTHKALYNNSTCGTFPVMNTVIGGRYKTGVWQRVRLGASSSPRVRVLAVSARWDTRALPLPPTVKVLLYSDVTPVPILFCQLWYVYSWTRYYGEAAPDVVRLEVTYSWSEAEGPVSGTPEPYVGSCAVPLGHASVGPAALCLVEAPCDSSSVALSVQGAPLPPDVMAMALQFDSAHVGVRVGVGVEGASVGVCARWVHGAEDVSGRLVEWLQLLKRFGVATVYMYISGQPLHSNVKAVLQHCGQVTLCHITMLSPPPPPSHRRHHSPRYQPPSGHLARFSLVALNDCLYSSLTRHDWLLPLDLDEMVLPLQHGTYPRLMAAALGPEDALQVRGRWFPPAAQRAPRPARAPALLHHLWRADNYTHRDWFSATFLRTSTVLTMHSHSPAHCLARTGAPRACRSRRLAPTRAVAHDYRADCGLRPRLCLAARSRPVRDSAMLRWSDVDIDVRGILKLLNISDEHSIL